MLARTHQSDGLLKLQLLLEGRRDLSIFICKLSFEQAFAHFVCMTSRSAVAGQLTKLGVIHKWHLTIIWTLRRWTYYSFEKFQKTIFNRESSAAAVLVEISKDYLQETNESKSQKTISFSNL